MLGVHDLMATLYTCSYSAWRPEHGLPVRTSLGKPKWLPEAASWPLLWEITPRGHYFKAPTEVYDAEYLAQLERYGARRIARRLGEIARSGFAEPAERLVLLCFESPETAEWACHRRTFAAWWLRQTGERVEELDR